MADALDLLHNTKLQRYLKKEDLSSNSNVSPELISKEMPVIESISLQINPSNFTSIHSTNDRIFCGSSSGNVLIFSLDSTLIVEIPPKKGFNTSIVSMDTFESTHLIAGSSQGHILLYDLKNFKLIKIFNSFSDPVLKIKFGKTLDEAIAMSNKMHSIQLKKKLLRYSLKSSELFALTDNLITFEILKDKDIDESYAVIISFDRMMFYNLHRKILMFEISSIKPKEIPYIAWIADNQKFIVSLSYGNTIVIYNVLKEGFNASACFQTRLEACGLKWVRNDVLVVFGRYSDAYVYAFEGRKESFVQELRVGSEIVKQSFVLDKIGLPCIAYHNSVSGLSNITLLGNTKIMSFNFITWANCLDMFVEKDKWLEAFSLALILFQGSSIGYIITVPGKYEILRKMHELMIKFAKESRFTTKNKIAISLEFCVKFGIPDFLFSHIVDILSNDQSNKESLELFINELYPYVQNGVISNIPSGILGKITDLLAQMNKFELLESLILHIDPVHLDYKLLTPICDKFNLIDAYIYLNTRSPLQSFVNPLKKLFKLASKSIDLPKKQYYAYTLLWYLRLCYIGKTFPEDKIKEESKEQILIKTTDWLIKRKHIINLLEIDNTITLKVLNLLFDDPKLFEILNKNPSTIKPFLQKIDFIITTEASSPSYIQFAMKAFDLCVYLMQKESAISVSKYLIEKSYPDSSSASITNTLVLKLLKSYSNYSASEIADLFKSARSSQYIEILSYLYRISGDHNESLLCYIQSDNPEIRKNVFNVIDEIFKEISEDSQPGFKEVISRRMNELSEIDTELLGKLITAWFQGEHSLTIEKLSVAPRLQMKYIKDLLKSSSSIDKKLSFIYVRLLCEYHPKELVDFLKTYDDLPYNECLQIVQNYNHIEAISYVNEKLGSIKEAILILNNKTKDIKYEIVKLIKSGQNIKDQDVFDMKYYIEKAKDVCDRNSTNFEDIEKDEYWYTLLKNLLDIYSDFEVHFQAYPVLFQLLDDSLKNILESLINHVDFEAFITQISKNYGSLPFKHFKDSTISVLSRFSYKENLISKANSLMLSDQSELMQSLVNNYTKGLCSDDFYCGKCKMDVERTSMLNPENKLIVFDCGHVFHASCIKIQNCETCRNSEARVKSFVNSLKNASKMKKMEF